jgi:predicted DNA-binding transcriptional regulator AlpA
MAAVIEDMGRVFEALQTLTLAFPASTVLQVERGQVEVQEPDREPVIFRLGPLAQIDQAAERAVRMPIAPDLPLIPTGNRPYYAAGENYPPQAGPPDESGPDEAPAWRKMKPAKRSKVLSVAQVAHRLGISTWSVIRKTKKGDMPYLSLSPRRLGFDADAVDRWVAAGMPQGVSAPRVTCTRRVKPKGGTA